MISKKFLLSEIIIASIIFVWLSYSFITIATLQLPKRSNYLPKTSAIFKLRKCLLYAYDWKSSSPQDYIIQCRACINESIPEIQFDKFYMGRFGENKMFLPMKTSVMLDDEKHFVTSTATKNNNIIKCNWLTIGIGGTSNSEKLSKQKYPFCSIYGIEPSPDQYANFKDYGTIIPYAVGATPGTFNLTIREKKKYIIQEMQVMAMSDILDKYIGTRIIQYMTIDIEGFEFQILEELLQDGILHNQGISFCQIDAELHGKDKRKTMQILHKFNLETSDYFPVITTKFLIHEKVTWINFREESCKKFFELDQFLV